MIDQTARTMRVSPARWVAAHFAAYRKREKWPFLWRISLEGLLVPLVLAWPLIVLFDLPPRVEDIYDPKFWLMAVIIAPVLETILLQVFPVMVARRLGAGFWIQVMAGLGLFAGVHFFNGVGSGLAAGLLSGFYLSFTYVHWRDVSLSAAVWMTSATHSIHNLAICGISFAAQSLAP